MGNISEPLRLVRIDSLRSRINILRRQLHLAKTVVREYSYGVDLDKLDRDVERVNWLAKELRMASKELTKLSNYRGSAKC